MGGSQVNTSRPEENGAQVDTEEHARCLCSASQAANQPQLLWAGRLLALAVTRVRISALIPD
jgi:hypothetical protein